MRLFYNIPVPFTRIPLRRGSRLRVDGGQTDKGRGLGPGCAPSALRRASGLLTLLVYTLSTLALQVRISPEIFGATRGSSKAGAMTIGCARASCCSSKCYLDEDGFHHCVPEDKGSPACTFSAEKSCRHSPLEMAAALDTPYDVSPEFPLIPLVSEFPSVPVNADVSAPTPPPRH